MSRAFKLDTAGGQVWDFNDPTCPLRLASDPTGIEGAAFGFDDQKNVGQAGVTYRARNDEPNYIGLDIHVGPVPKGPEAQELLQRVWDSFGRGKQIHTFHSITDYKGDLTQLVRLAEATALPTSMLTQIRDTGYARIQKKLRSDETWFRKKPVEKSFTAAQFAGATIVSESVEPVWPYFELTGPITTPTLGVAGEAVPLPTIGAGQTWIINTDPDFFSIRDHLDVDRSWVLRYWHTQAPAAEPGSSVDVPVTITGTGTSSATKLKVILPQLFWSGI
jgi:hypothetical protein